MFTIGWWASAFFIQEDSVEIIGNIYENPELLKTDS